MLKHYCSVSNPIIGEFSAQQICRFEIAALISPTCITFAPFSYPEWESGTLSKCNLYDDEIKVQISVEQEIVDDVRKCNIRLVLVQSHSQNER